METHLLKDLTVVLVSASVVSILFSALRWPVILGYLLAGLLVGPHGTPMLWVQNQATIQEISELGVIFLMFYIGLEFDLRKLKQTFFPAFTAMVLQTFFAFFMGTALAPMLGWSTLQGSFLGAILAISSTMVAVPILRAKNALKQSFAQFTIGISVFEDILAVILLVLLASTGQKSFRWSQSLDVVFWIAVFVAGMFFFGRLLAPRLMQALHRIGNEEVLHVCLIGLILLLGELADGFSTALGAFIAGAIFSSTRLAERLEKIIAPIRDIFTAVFFISIGMLIEPHWLWKHKNSIIVLSLAVVFGKLFAVWLGLFLSGQKSRMAFQAALPKAQIGEFSFVIAALGKSLGVVDGGLMAVTVGVSLLSIILVNLLSFKEEALLNRLQRVTPRVLKEWGDFYQNFLLSLQNHLSGSHFWQLVRRPFAKIAIHFFLINAIVWLNAWLCAYLENYALPYLIWIQRGLSLCALLLALPFMIGVIRSINITVLSICKTALKGLFHRLMQHPGLYQIFQSLVVAFAVAIFAWLFLAASARFLPSYMPLLTFTGLAFVLGLSFWKRFSKINSQIEWMFLESFKTELETDNEKRKRAILKVVSKKHPWDIQVQTITLHNDSAVIGKRIFETHLRRETGATVLGISRNGYLSYDTSPETTLFPGDQVVVLGTPSQIGKAEQSLNHMRKPDEEGCLECSFDFGQIVVPNDSFLANETLAGAGVRKKFGVNVVGIQRNVQRIENPKPDDILKGGDILLVIGKMENISDFQNALM